MVAVAQSVRALDCGAADAMCEHEAMLPHHAFPTMICDIVAYRPANNGKRFQPVFSGLAHARLSPAPSPL